MHVHTHCKHSLSCDPVDSVTSGACVAIALSLQASSAAVSTTIPVRSTTTNCRSSIVDFHGRGVHSIQTWQYYLYIPLLHRGTLDNVKQTIPYKSPAIKTERGLWRYDRTYCDKSYDRFVNSVIHYVLVYWPIVGNFVNQWEGNLYCTMGV